jgi:hypothetical protein
MLPTHETDYWSARNSAEEQLGYASDADLGSEDERYALSRAAVYARLAQASAVMVLAKAREASGE